MCCSVRSAPASLSFSLTMLQRPLQSFLYPLVLPIHSTYYQSDNQKGSNHLLPPRTRTPFFRRGTRWGSVFKLVALIALCALLVIHLIPDPVGDWIKRHPHERLPPTYTAYKEREKALVPNDKDSKFFFPARYVSGAYRIYHIRFWSHY